MSIQDNNAVKADQGKLRKFIRKKVAEILKDKTDAGPRVFPNSSIPPWVEDLPVILVFQRGEDASKYAEAPRELQRDLDIVIEIYAAGPEIDEDGNPPKDADGNEKKTLEDILDDVAEQIEVEMARDDTLQETASESILTNTEFEFEGSGGVPTGTARLTYGVTYYTMSPRSDDPRPDLKKTVVEWNTDGDDSTIQAEDEVDIPVD